MSNAPLLIRTGNQVLEPDGIGGIAGNGNIHMLQLHHLNGLFDAGIAVDLDIGALAVGESLFAQDLQRLGGMVKGGFHIGKAIKAGQCVAGILAQTIEDDTQGIFTDLIGAADNADAALRRREGFVTGQKAEAAGILIQQHSG